MKQAKYVLSALSLLAVASFAIASKAKVASTFYQTNFNKDQRCDQETQLFLTPTTERNPEMYSVTFLSTQPLRIPCPAISVTTTA